MLRTMAVLEQVAAGKLTPEEAADIIVRNEREARERQRPAWFPKRVWMIGSAAGAAALAFFGVTRD